jgi:MscS family membrane protein
MADTPLSPLMEYLHTFWSLVADVWKNGVFGVDVGRFVAAIGILLLFLLLRRGLARFIMNRLERFVESTSTTADDQIMLALKNPVRFVPVVLGVFFALEFMNFPEPFATFAENLVKSLILVVIFWGLYNLAGPLSHAFKRLETVLTPPLVGWLVKLVKVLVVLTGAASVLEMWGIDVGPILAGLGLFSVAVALGAKDLFQNIIAGISIIAESRFNIGDWIKVEGEVEGTVEAIGFRSTKIRRFDLSPAFVPNAQLSDNCLTNFSQMTYRRISWIIGLEYRTSVQQLQTIRDRVLEYITTNDEFAPPEKASTFMRVNAFGDSSIDFMLYCFTKTTTWGEWLRIKEDLALRIKQIVENEAGAAFAFPSQSIYVEQLPDDKPEIFTPPGE